MTRFLDGPAAGIVLDLRRAPLFLRVVRDRSENGEAEWDALDQLADTPEEHETIHVYRRLGPAGWVHLDGTDKRGRRFGQTLATGEYVLHAEQPGDEITRTTARWRNWAEIERDRLLAQTNTKESSDERQTEC